MPNETGPIVNVTQTITRIHGVTPLRLNDIYADAPEPGTVADGLRSTTANLQYLLTLFDYSNFRDPSGRLVEAQAFQIIQNQDRPEPGDYERNWPFKQAPKDFQLRIFAAARHMDRIALAPVAMGTGKTKMTLDITADKFMRDEIDCLCVIAPNGVHRQWVNEAVDRDLTSAVWAEKAIWKATRKTPPLVLGTERRGRRTLRILTFNVESFSSESGKAFMAARAFLQSGRGVLVEDESSRIKNPRAARTKAIHKLRQYAKVRINLSGTPITRGLEDLWSQYELLDPAILGMSNYYAFRGRYCTMVPAFRGAAFGQIKIVGYKNVEEFVRKIAPFTFVVPKDVLGLPEKTYERREVEMTDEQRKLYDMLRDELVNDLRAQQIKTPANAAVRLMRLQQVLCGRKIESDEYLDEDGNLINRDKSVMIDNRRLGVLWDVLCEHDGPAVIWCRYTDDIEDVKSFLEEQGKRVVTYYGETSIAERDEAKRAFREGEADYFIGNPAAAGIGLDGLQEVAELAVYYSNSFSAEDRWQSEDRIHRLGMRGRAHYVDLVVPGTVDTLVLENLKNKGSLAKAVFYNPESLENGRLVENEVIDTGERVLERYQ